MRVRGNVQGKGSMERGGYGEGRVWRAVVEYGMKEEGASGGGGRLVSGIFGGLGGTLLRFAGLHDFID